MEPLPDAVETTLLRGVAAYLRATPANALPNSVRRFQNFRPKSLAAHKRQILDALDDAAFRALVKEWLDERPTLSKADGKVLRTAVERPNGWHEELGAASRPKPAPAKPRAESSDAVEREREKLRKARDDARRKLEEAQREIKVLARRIAELENQLKGSVDEAAALAKEVAAARRRADKAAADLEREQRKSRAALERSDAAATKARSDLKDARRELQSMKREVERNKAPARKKTQVRKKKPSVASGPRRALSVPKGRFEDDPATLEAWLAADGVHLLVDGYNASMSQAGFAHLELADQRQRLVDEVVKLARRVNVPTTVVFDGSNVSGAIRQPRGPAKVHYSAPDEIADDHLIGLIESMPQTPVIVATSDRELQERAASLGATIATSEQLLKLLR